MSSTARRHATGRHEWVAAAGTFTVYFFAALVCRLAVHLTGWRHYTLGESLRFAAFFGFFMAVVMPLIDRYTKR